MARTALTKTTMLGGYGSYTANAADITWAAGDVANGNEVTLKEGDIVLAWNQGASVYYVDVTSVASAKTARLGDIDQYDVGIDEVAVLGPFKADGWRQSDGTLWIDVENASVYLAVLTQ